MQKQVLTTKFKGLSKNENVYRKLR